MNSLDFKIDIESASSLRTLQSMQKETEAAIVKLELLRSVSGSGTRSAELDQLYDKLGKIRDQVHDMGFGERFKSEMLAFAESIPLVGNLMRSLNGAVGPVSTAIVAFGGAAEVVHKLNAAYEQSEQRLVGLRAALALTAHASDTNAQSIMALVKAQKEFAIAGSESQPVIETLLKLGRVRVDQLGQEVNLSKVWRL